MANFGNLYNYNSSSGVVIPQTSEIKANIEQAFKEIFGSSFSTKSTTINGRLIEALTTLFVDVCGVNAQNMNGLNLTQAVGSFLDGLGGMFKIDRHLGESDSSYRSRIVMSASRGSGFASSIRQAISEIPGVTGVVVLDNGLGDPSALPVDAFGNPVEQAISVSPHSIFVCVKGGDSNAIARAIMETRSLGCGYAISEEYGTPEHIIIQDTDLSNTSFEAYIYRPTRKYIKFEVTVNGRAYTGSDIVGDTKASIARLVDDKSMNDVLTKSDIISAIAAIGSNIVCTSQTITVSDTSPSLDDGAVVDKIVVLPYKYITSGDTEEERESFLANNIVVTVI